MAKGMITFTVSLLCALYTVQGQGLGPGGYGQGASAGAAAAGGPGGYGAGAAAAAGGSGGYGAGAAGAAGGSRYTQLTYPRNSVYTTSRVNNPTNNNKESGLYLLSNILSRVNLDALNFNSRQPPQSY